MKKIFIIIFVFTVATGLKAQVDVNQKLDEAESAYSSKDLEATRFALQEALQGINQAIGKEILDMLPSELGEMKKVEGQDNVTGTTIMFAGLFVSRSYEKDSTLSANFEIMSDSPLITSINAFMAMPAIMVTDPNQKRIKVDNYRGMLTRSEDSDGTVNYDAQIPVGSTLFSFRTHGISDEKSVTDMLTLLQIGKIAKIAE